MGHAWCVGTGPMVLLLSVLATAACGASGQSSGVGDPPSAAEGDDVVVGSVPSPQPGPGVPSADDLMLLPAAPTEGRAGGGELESISWALLGIVDDGREVAITYSVGGCVAPDHVSVVESDDEVAITVRVRMAVDPEQPCVQSAQVFNQLVTLDAPLGNRPLVDPASSEDGSDGATPCPSDSCVGPESSSPSE